MKQKKIGDILYVFQQEAYTITDDTDVVIIYVPEESYSAYKTLNPSLSQLAKKNYDVQFVSAPEWNIYRYLPEKDPSIVLNENIEEMHGADIDGNNITVEDSIDGFKLFDNDVEADYSSSDENVATIDENGNVSIEAPGTTTITASSEGDETHEGFDEEYTLTVTEGNKERLDPEIEFETEVVTVYNGENIQYPELSNPNNLGISYSTTDTENLITVNKSNGHIIINFTYLYDKEFFIYATFAGNDTYLPKQVYYKLIVKPSRQDANLYFSPDDITATIGEANEYPTLVNPANLEVNYYSSDTDKAEVNLYNGNVTLKEVTSSIIPVKISAVFTGNDLYKPKTVQYVLWIEEKEEPPVPVQDTLDVIYQASDGIIQLYGDIVTPTPTQDTLDTVYESNNGAIQIYGDIVTPPTPIQTTLDAQYSSENGSTQLYGQLSQAEII